ncbi:hypothetical protein [Microvirga calopogonii]|uniref:hypothetical protein n=1 Tax=Microvirga calopogonii TaxID=2078013 RepID=UPI0013B3B3D2|nr:hypothetical protein [Microvirga calopogonii]
MHGRIFAASKPLRKCSFFKAAALQYLVPWNICVTRQMFQPKGPGENLRHMGDIMKNVASAPEIADPYAALEKILKVIGRTWLSEEWRLEDIRLLAQEAIASRGKRVNGKGAASAAPPRKPQLHFKSDLPLTPPARGERRPS